MNDISFFLALGVACTVALLLNFAVIMWDGNVRVKLRERKRALEDEVVGLRTTLETEREQKMDCDPALLAATINALREMPGEWTADDVMRDLDEFLEPLVARMLTVADKSTPPAGSTLRNFISKRPLCQNRTCVLPAEWMVTYRTSTETIYWCEHHKRAARWHDETSVTMTRLP